MLSNITSTSIQAKMSSTSLRSTVRMLAPSARRPPPPSLPLRVTISNFVGPRRNGHVANCVTYNGLLVMAAVTDSRENYPSIGWP